MQKGLAKKVKAGIFGLWLSRGERILHGLYSSYRTNFASILVGPNCLSKSRAEQTICMPAPDLDKIRKVHGLVVGEAGSARVVCIYAQGLGACQGRLVTAKFETQEEQVLVSTATLLHDPPHSRQMRTSTEP